MSTAASMQHRANSLREQAKSHVQAKRWAEAGHVLRELQVMYPGNVEVLTQISYMESLLGHYRAARAYALEAGRYLAADPGVSADQMARLRTFNDGVALQHLIAKHGPLTRMPIQLLVAAAAQLSYLNLQDRALALLDEAKRGDPEFPPTLMSRAQILMYLGRFDEARKDVVVALRRAPELAQPYWLLAQIGKRSPHDNHVTAMRGLLSDPRLRPADRAELAFALHKELDDLGDVDGAWQALEQACEAKRGMMKYAIEDSRGLVDDLIALPAPAPASASVSPVDAPGRAPLFIVGMHRSGTTLLEQLLDGSPEVHGVGELYDFTSEMRYATDHHCKGVIDRTIVQRAAAGGVDFADVGRRYLDGMAWRLGSERFFTDKLPSNFLNIGFICRALPHAKILHMVRDPVETCFSNLRELFSEANPYSYDQLELADYYLQYRRLMAHWHATYPGRILDVDYAELTRDPESVMRGVAAFCGIGYTDAMCDPRSSTRAVSTASAVQVRERVVRREVPKWAPYAKRLQPLIGALRQGGVEVPEPPA